MSEFVRFMRKKYAFLCLMLLCLMGCKEQNYFEKLATLDVGLGTPKAGDWLAEHQESGQTFAQYQKLEPLKVSTTQKYIYILPIGNFTAKEQKICALTSKYLSLFYDVPTKLLPVISDSVVPKDKRRWHDENEQLDASYLMDVVEKHKPKDALVVMGLTSKDLYPKPSWNFVFGLATYSKGVGVTSFFRYGPELADYRVCLERTIKTSAHEIGHMFKLKHCTHAVCVMNGVNSLREDDGKPNTLCSVCLQKLQYNFGFNCQARFKKLLYFYQQHGMQRDAEIIKNQLTILE